MQSKSPPHLREGMSGSGVCRGARRNALAAAVAHAAEIGADDEASLLWVRGVGGEGREMLNKRLT